MELSFDSPASGAAGSSGSHGHPGPSAPAGWPDRRDKSRLSGVSSSGGGGSSEFTTDWTIPPRSGSRHRQLSNRPEAPSPSFRTLSQSQLLHLAHSTVDAARDHDPDLVESDALRLFEAMSHHVLAQRTAIRQLPAGDALLIRRGQQKIENLLLELAASADRKIDVCECESLAERVAAQMDIQGGEERRYLHAAADGTQPMTQFA